MGQSLLQTAAGFPWALGDYIYSTFQGAQEKPKARIEGTIVFTGGTADNAGIYLLARKAFIVLRDRLGWMLRGRACVARMASQSPTPTSRAKSSSSGATAAADELSHPSRAQTGDRVCAPCGRLTASGSPSARRGSTGVGVWTVRVDGSAFNGAEGAWQRR